MLKQTPTCTVITNITLCRTFSVEMYVDYLAICESHVTPMCYSWHKKLAVWYLHVCRNNECDTHIIAILWIRVGVCKRPCFQGCILPTQEWSRDSITAGSKRPRLLSGPLLVFSIRNPNEYQKQLAEM
jgi:hypothetical protein